MSDDFESYLHLYRVAKRRIKMTVHDIGTPSMQPSGTAFFYIFAAELTLSSKTDV